MSSIPKRTINKENEIIFTIARMNPPTPGHLMLIKTMMQLALQKGLSQINIILSSTIDNEKNPLECEEKRRYLYGGVILKAKQELLRENPSYDDAIEKMWVEIICMNDDVDINIHGKHPILSKISYILNYLYGYPRPGIKMFLVIGGDRIDSYGFVIQSLTSKTPIVNCEVIGLSRPEGAMSATYIRSLALSGTLEKKNEFFMYMQQLGINKDDIQSIYDQIKENITKFGGKKSKKNRKIRRLKKSKKSKKSKKTRKSKKNKKT
jgi:hypothetical protein